MVGLPKIKKEKVGESGDDLSTDLFLDNCKD
jgi:hypothetical protein